MNIRINNISLLDHSVRIILLVLLLSVPGLAQGAESAPPWAHPKASSIPAEGDGDFGVAEGNSPVVGEGRRLRFMVEVEFGVGEHADRFARLVEEILFDPRSWSGSDSYALQRVDTGPVDFRVTLASPSTVDEFCDPLDTKGVYSCWNGNRAMINLWRWYSGHPIFSSLSDYRSHVINHEVGHALGKGHVNRCPDEGRPASVMMQQTINLHGCESNAWVDRTRNEPPRRAYARVFGETLSYSQIAREKTEGGQGSSTLVAGTGEARRVSARKLYQIVFRFLYYDYLDNNNLTATDTEVRQLADTLEKRTYWLNDKAELTGFLKTYVRNWKFRQRLYSQYEGEVRRDMFGFVPVEAYRTFLQKRQKSGDFEIFVSDLRKRFWTINPRSAVFLSVPVRRERVGQVINNPPWMSRTTVRP